MINIQGKILVSKVWCITDADKDIEEITGELAAGIWLDHAIDLSIVTSMKITSKEDSNAVLYTYDDRAMTVDISFKELLPKWIEIRNDK